jgi:hypothetical protein
MITASNSYAFNCEDFPLGNEAQSRVTAGMPARTVLIKSLRIRVFGLIVPPYYMNKYLYFLVLVPA